MTESSFPAQLRKSQPLEKPPPTRYWLRSLPLHPRHSGRAHLSEKLLHQLVADSLATLIVAQIDMQMCRVNV